MAYRRTTLLLDEETREAARDLAHRLGVSTSQAIREAILRYRDLKAGVPVEERQRRVKVLQRLIEAFEGHDPGEEVRRLKEEDEGF